MTVAVVTGASRGIGRAIAEALGARGLQVALLARSQPGLAEVASAIPGAMPIPCDVADEGSVEAAKVRVLSELGTPAVVVPCAGILRRGAVPSLALADFEEVLRVNLTGTFLTGTFLTARAFLPAMLAARRGRIVAVASISATLGTPEASAYNASKWGLVGFVKSLAEELRETGLQALCVSPGAVDTDMLKRTPFEPAMTASDVAGLVTYLALDAPAAMNGAAVDCFG